MLREILSRVRLCINKGQPSANLQKQLITPSQVRELLSHHGRRPRVPSYVAPSGQLVIGQLTYMPEQSSCLGRYGEVLLCSCHQALKQLRDRIERLTMSLATAFDSPSQTFPRRQLEYCQRYINIEPAFPFTTPSIATMEHAFQSRRLLLNPS